MYCRNETRNNFEEAMSLTSEIQGLLEEAFDNLDELEKKNSALEEEIEQNEKFIEELTEQNNRWHDEVIELRKKVEHLQKAYKLLKDINEFFEEEIDEIIAEEIEKEFNEENEDCPF